MKILFIANAVSIHTIRFVEYFASQGDDVHLISYLPWKTPVPGVTLHIPPSPFSNIYLDFLPRQIWIHRCLKKIRPDIVHALYVSKFGWHLILLRGVKKVLTALGDDILILPHKGRHFFLATRFAVERADRIYAVSEHIRQIILSDYQIPPEKVETMAIGVDTSLFYPAPVPRKPSSEIRLFSNRGFRPEYNPGTIIDAVALVHETHPQVRLYLKGDGPERVPFEDYVSEKGYDSFIFFLDKTPYHLVPRDYQRADIFISAARSDGTPVSMLEAMACGTACIMTDVGGIPEWIKDGYNGLLYPPKRPGILADTIRFLIDNPDIRDELGDHAHQTIQDRGDWNRLMARLRDDYKTLYQT